MVIENLKRVMEDYIPDETIWREYDDTMLHIKSAMNALSDADRIIFALYCEFGSLRKVGKQLGVSHSIIYKNIRRIKLEMLEWIKDNTNDYELADRMEVILKKEDEE